MDWVYDPDSKRIFWLSGAAGTGKSTVANSVAQRLDAIGRLGASFRFDRDVATSDTPGQLFGNLTYQLTHFNDQFRASVLSAVHRGCGGAMPLRMQAKRLFVESIRDTEVTGPVVIIIDALDESGADDGKPEASRETLVRAIVEELPALLPSIKVLITSRDEGSISRLMPRCLSCLHKDIMDVAGTTDDILRYIQQRMHAINESCHEPLNGWPGRDRETQLALNADGLFIWADVACTFVESGDDPYVQLEELLNPSDELVAAEAKLDNLFLDVIHCSLSDDSIIRLNNWHYVVDTIATLKTPLTSNDMDSLLGVSARHPKITLFDGRQIKLTTTSHIISSLKPMLRIDADGSGVVRLLHKSVFDFLTSRAHEPIYVDLGRHSGILAIQCLQQMNSKSSI